MAASSKKTVMARPAQTKQHVSQKDAGYRRGYPLRSCGTCAMYWHRDTGKQFGGCTKVTGSITPYGLCKYFQQLNNPFGLISGEARQQIEDFYDAAPRDGKP